MEMEEMTIEKIIDWKNGDEDSCLELTSISSYKQQVADSEEL
jgi:hypothetical protein